jgi:hypothetical protein
MMNEDQFVNTAEDMLETVRYFWAKRATDQLGSSSCTKIAYRCVYAGVTEEDFVAAVKDSFASTPHGLEPHAVFQKIDWARKIFRKVGEPV